MTTRQFVQKTWTLFSLGLLIVAVTACNPFGGKADPTATPPPPATETPLPMLPTYTPTAVAEPPTPTPAAESPEEAKPTLTPTPEGATQPEPAQPEVGGDGETQPVAPVTYKTIAKTEMGELLANGSFEDGFDEKGVGTGWSTFDNEGAVYAWVQDIQASHVSHGQSAQLMRVMGPGQPDRFVGIYQTFDVVAGETYTLTMHGIIKSSTADDHKTPYGHRVQWAIDPKGQGYWPALDTWAPWTDTGWNDVPLKTANPTMNAFVTHITPDTEKLTIFVRGWTKWPILGSEAMYYIDGISVQGAIPGTEEKVVVSSGGDGTEENMPTTGGADIWVPITGVVLVLGFGIWEMRKSWARAKIE